MMDDTRKTIYDNLKSLVVEFPTLKVYQQRPEVLESFPCITFNIESNVPTYTLDRGIGRQTIVVKIDIWTQSSNNGKDVLIEVENVLRNIDYLLTYNLDILDSSGIFHITTQFTY